METAGSLLTVAAKTFADRRDRGPRIIDRDLRFTSEMPAATAAASADNRDDDGNRVLDS